MTEPSIEQAALARATGNDWQARAEREAAVILAQALSDEVGTYGMYATMVSLVAIGWLQGVNYGAHETLRQSEAAFARLQADL